MGRDSVQRFSAGVEDYIRYRPSYPTEIISLLERSCDLSAASVVADIGSGTGLLSELFLGAGCDVLGVEPNSEMREAGERLLGARYTRFRSVAGHAEATTLPDASVDFVTAGQAFHWFEAESTRAEFRRILNPRGWVVLVWNERLTSTNFLAQYEELLHRYAPEYSTVDHRRVDAEVLDRFFGNQEWGTARFPNEQRFDLAGVIGRLHSASYAPKPGAAMHDEMIQDLERIFATHNENGFVAFLYETRMHYGRLQLP